VNGNADLCRDNPKFVMRITGDNDEGKAELDNFIDPESRYPVITTTSKLMTTGIDAQTCQLIVLDQRIQSMTEFKQIIGRGTRVNEDYGKYYFTIMDFRKVTELFADPDFDGDPVQIYEPKEDEPIVPPDEEGGEASGEGNDGADPIEEIIIDEPPHKPVRYVVDDVGVDIVSVREQYYGKDGKLITESLNDYTRKTVTEEFDSLDDFVRRWSEADKKQAIIGELTEQGVLFDALADEVGKDFDPFDLICHVAFGQPPLTRKERADNVKKRHYFAKYGEQARAVLEALLDKYADGGIENIEDMGVLKVQPINQFGSPVEIVRAFGGKESFQNAIQELEEQLYQSTAA